MCTLVLNSTQENNECTKKKKMSISLNQKHITDMLLFKSTTLIDL